MTEEIFLQVSLGKFLEENSKEMDDFLKKILERFLKIPLILNEPLKESLIDFLKELFEEFPN